ncbi:MAG: hypothetical protein JXA20_17640 [Spirochaetes bacterium]|nr:hypothetical protein [Spirochaetota bacterium]
MKDRKDLLLGVDIGCQYAKAAMFDAEGNVLSLARLSQEPDSLPNIHWVEHDTESYFKTACSAIKKALAPLGPDISRLRAVGLTTFRNTNIAVDEKGKALRPAVVYLDKRENLSPPPLTLIWKVIFRLIGRHNAIQYVRKNSKFTWIRQNEPEIYNKTHKFVQASSYINYHLTGQMNETIPMMVGTFPFNVKKGEFFTQSGIHDAFGITPDLLPDLIPALSISGTITQEASEKTGIPQGLPVVVGGGDIQTAVVGMGAVDEGSASMVLGTTVRFQISSEKYVSDKENRFMPWPAAVPGRYCLETTIPGGFLSITWFGRELSHLEAQRAASTGISTEQVLDEAGAQIPPGSLGLIVHPYWVSYIGHENARGSILGLNLMHTRAHVYRALIEGIAYESRVGCEVIEERTGTRPREVRISGGPAKSDLVMTILADVLQIPTVRMKVSEAGALGAAICAAAGTGLFRDYREAIASMVQDDRRFEPNPANAAVYTRLFNVYKSVYPRIAEYYDQTNPANW